MVAQSRRLKAISRELNLDYYAMGPSWTGHGLLGQVLKDALLAGGEAGQR
ncbi:hypothetical protein ACFLIM_48015 [Nonomuraea sp. M3C6]|uniref:Uncharacterized protein n=1 Tax=Nonomuraea marmarensis TaxID=3351344 RepID=A0ABW7AXZ1_9ACTN